MACCSYILLTFIKFLAFILPSWASEKQPIAVVFRQKKIPERIIHGASEKQPITGRKKFQPHPEADKEEELRFL